MIKIVSAAVAVLSALIVPARAQPAADPVIFGAIPAVTDVKISPDGSTLAMLRAVDDKMSVVFYDLADPDSKPAGVQVGGGKARDLVWANDEHVLVLASQTGRMQTTTGLETIEFFRWFSVSKSTMKSIVLFGNEGNLYISSAGNLIATTPSDPDRALFARYYTLKAGGGSYDLLSADLKRGDEKLVDAGTRRTYDWLVSRTGNPLARLDYDDLKKATILYARADGEGQFQRIKEFEDKPGAPSSISFYGLAPNGEEFVAALPGAGNRRALVSMSPFTGEVLSTLFAHEEFDIDGVIYDYRKATATGARFTDDIPRYVHFDPDEQKIQDSLEKALPGASPSIISKSADGEKTVVKVLYTDHPEQYFLFDRSAKTLNMVASAYPAIDGKVAAKKERFDHTSSDGLEIPGYLTVPSGASRQNMPLIVLPHGGPQGRDDMTFDWWSFFYAANGYLVYQPNFRGSDGYGADFVAAGFGEWGRKMQDDITYGVKKLIADGTVDPKRICIVGGSYGGYAALAGATLTPDLYACAVSVNGVSNLPALIGRSARWSDWAEDYWDVRLGSRSRDKKELEAVSPNLNAEKAIAPILLIHGRDDTVVPYSHAIRMHDALKAAKKSVELVELKGEDHWLSRAATRITTLEKSLEFIDRHIGIGAPH
ncbi:MAG TPA: S9 family peptidase [Parvularculaceae bacterium]|nr:S9 family peptidase [Parvularculaceae bacterium]